MGFFARIRARWRAYTRQEKIVLSVTYVGLFLWALWTLVGFYYLLINAVKDVKEFNNNPLGFPSYLKWKNFSLALKMEYRNTNVIQMLGNSIIFATTFTASNVGASLLTAYTMARYEFRGKQLLISMAMVVQILPIFGTTGSAYLLAYNLGLVDNLGLLWITAFTGFDMQFLIMHSYFLNIDKAYSDAARIDGASQFTIFWKIMVPLIIPPIMVMSLSCIIGLWNNYTTSLIYFPTYPTLTTGIFNMQKLQQYVEGGTTAFLAGVLLSIIPLVILFLFTNKKIFKVNMQGGLKG